MARCEDYPCCGHELGCCPDYDASGRQLNMICTCGAKLPVTNRYSICDACLSRGDEEDNGRDFDEDGVFDDEEEDFDEEDDEEGEQLVPDAHLEDFGDFGYDGCHEE